MCRCSQPQQTRRIDARDPIDREGFACLLQDCLCRVAVTLPRMTAEILRRVDGEGQSPAVVAAALGLSLRETRARLHLARRRLLESLVGPVSRRGWPESR